MPLATITATCRRTNSPASIVLGSAAGWPLAARSPPPTRSAAQGSRTRRLARLCPMGWLGPVAALAHAGNFALAMAALTIDAMLHGLRHTYVSQLIAAGLDVLTISRRIGHALPTITLAVYGHLFSSTDARAAEIMQATFTKVRT